MPLNRRKLFIQRCRKAWIHLILNNRQVMLLINHYGCHIELFKAKYEKYFYWKKCQESKLHADYVTYKKYQNRAVAKIRKAKKSFEKKLSDNIKSDPKSFMLMCVVRVKLKLKLNHLEFSQTGRWMKKNKCAKF